MASSKKEYSFVEEEEADEGGVDAGLMLSFLVISVVVDSMLAESSLLVELDIESNEFAVLIVAVCLFSKPLCTLDRRGGGPNASIWQIEAPKAMRILVVMCANREIDSSDLSRALAHWHRRRLLP
mmetsp:Transcript_49/g.115  ORF Transcript_49/g.115 Transcript_49/m.115 type:complete len:125 (-) Transcript_49:413-787(-)